MYEFPTRTVSYVHLLSKCMAYGIPVPATAHDHHLGFHGLNVLQRPFLWVNAAFDSSILSGQTECIPTDGMQDLVALHTLEACQDIRDGVYAQMA